MKRLLTNYSLILVISVATLPATHAAQNSCKTRNSYNCSTRIINKKTSTYGKLDKKKNSNASNGQPIKPVKKIVKPKSKSKIVITKKPTPKASKSIPPQTVPTPIPTTSPSSSPAQIPSRGGGGPGPLVVLSKISGLKTFTIGTVGKSIKPFESSGGSTISYKLTGELPAGLNFSESTGLITGTPTSLVPEKSLIVNIYNNGALTDTATFSVKVDPAIIITGPSQVPSLIGTGAKSDPYSATGGAGSIVLSESVSKRGAALKKTLSLLEKPIQEDLNSVKSYPAKSALLKIDEPNNVKKAFIESVVVPGKDINLDTDGRLLIGASIDIGTYDVTITATDSEGNNSFYIVTVKVGPAISNISRSDIPAPTCPTKYLTDGIYINKFDGSRIPGYGPGYTINYRVYESGDSWPWRVKVKDYYPPNTSSIINGLNSNKEYFIYTAIQDVTGAEKESINWCTRTTSSEPTRATGFTRLPKVVINEKSSNSLSHYVDGFHLNGYEGNFDEVPQKADGTLPFNTYVEIRKGNDGSNPQDLELIKSYPISEFSNINYPYSGGINVDLTDGLMTGSTYFAYVVVRNSDSDASYSEPTKVELPKDVITDSTSFGTEVKVKKLNCCGGDVISKYFDGLEVNADGIFNQIPIHLDGTKVFDTEWSIVGTYSVTSLPSETSPFNGGWTKIAPKDFACDFKYIHKSLGDSGYGCTYTAQLKITDKDGRSMLTGPAGLNIQMPNSDTSYISGSTISPVRYLDGISFNAQDLSELWPTFMDGSSPNYFKYKFKNVDSGITLETGSYPLNGSDLKFENLPNGTHIEFTITAYRNSDDSIYSYAYSQTTTMNPDEIRFPKLYSGFDMLWGAHYPIDTGYKDGFHIHWPITDTWSEWEKTIPHKIDGTHPYKLFFEISKDAHGWQTPVKIPYQDCGNVLVDPFYDGGLDTLCKIVGLQTKTKYKINLLAETDSTSFRSNPMEPSGTSQGWVETKTDKVSEVGGTLALPKLSSDNYTNQIRIVGVDNVATFTYFGQSLSSTDGLGPDSIFKLNYQISSVFEFKFVLYKSSDNSVVDQISFKQPYYQESNDFDNPFIFSGLTPNTSYKVKFVVTDPYGDSLESGPVSVTTLAVITS